jgi:hypothetical protein
LLKDVKEFLAGQAWYLKRGVPWRVSQHRGLCGYIL